MERLDANVCSMNPALQKTPKVFQCVRVHPPVHISDSVIDDLVRVFPFQSIIGAQFIGVERRPCFNVLLDFGLQSAFLAIADHGHLHLSAPLDKAYNGSLALTTPSGDAALSLRDVHVPGLAADEGLINFDLAL